MPGREQHEQVMRELPGKLDEVNRASMTAGEHAIRGQEKSLSILRERRERMTKDLHAMHDEVRRERDEMVKERQLLLAQVEELDACISYAEMFIASKWYQDQSEMQGSSEEPENW